MAEDLLLQKVPMKFIFLTGLNNCPILINAQQIVAVVKYDSYSNVLTNSKEVSVKETQAQIKALIEA